jgi:ATP-dependent helicase/nuclease subunit B
MTSEHKLNCINVPLGGGLLEFIANKFKDCSDICTSNSIVILPSQRANRLLQDKLLQIHGKNIAVMPRILTYSELHNNLLYFAPLMQDLNFAINPEISPIALDFLIANAMGNKGINWHYINEIKKFLVEFYTYVGNENLLDSIEDSELAALLKKIISNLSAKNFSLKQQARLQAIDYLAKASFKANNNANLILVAPSNISAVTLRLIKKLQEYQNSLLIFYGLSENKCPSQEAYHTILAKLNVPINSVLTIAEGKEFKEINQTSKEVPFWRGLDMQLLVNAKVLVCENQTQEAQLVALITKDKLSAKNTPSMAIVCEDEKLRQQVTIALKKWHIIPEISTALNLLQFKSLQLFYNLLELALSKNFSPSLLLSILKNPHIDFAITAELEIEALRPQLARSFDHLKKFPELQELVEQLKELHNVLMNNSKPLAVKYSRHRQLFLHFVKDLPSDVVDIFEEISQQILAYGNNFPIAGHEYASWLYRLLASNKLRQNYKYHPNVKLVTSIEAKFLDLDVVIFCGLNQNIFPSSSPHSNLISASQRAKLGLPLGEVNLHEQNLDFLNLLARKQCYLTYAKTVNKEACQPSIFLERLQLYKQKFQQDASDGEKENYLQWLQKINEFPQNFKKQDRLAPCPPLNVRPISYSAKAVAELINNPYHFYAHYILKLKPLDKLQADLSSKNFGIILHEAIAETLPNNASMSYQDFVEHFSNVFYKEAFKYHNTFEEKTSWPTRIARIAKWLWEYEVDLQASRRGYKSYHEITGKKYLVLADDYRVNIQATADRILLFNNSNALVIDYKTGQLPDKKEVTLGLAPQLPIEGWLLANGGYFKNCNYSNIDFAFLRLSGIKEVAEVKNIPIKIEDVEGELINLLRRFTIDLESYFVADAANKSFSSFYDPYQHLARNL